MSHDSSIISSQLPKSIVLSSENYVWRKLWLQSIDVGRDSRRVTLRNRNLESNRLLITQREMRRMTFPVTLLITSALLMSGRFFIARLWFLLGPRPPPPAHAPRPGGPVWLQAQPRIRESGICEENRHRGLLSYLVRFPLNISTVNVSNSMKWTGDCETLYSMIQS